MFRLRQQFHSGLHFKEMIKYTFSSSVLRQIMSAGKAPSWAIWGREWCLTSWWLKGRMMQFYLDTNQLLSASACSTYALLSSLSSFLQGFKCQWTHGHCSLPPTASLPYLTVLRAQRQVPALVLLETGHFLLPVRLLFFSSFPWHCVRRAALPKVLSISVLCSLGGCSMMDSRMHHVPLESGCI